jgi:hypothetical protein
MAQMPDIQPEINKEPQKEKKRGGFLARLFGGGTGGGTVGAGAFGGAGAGGGAIGSGLLATKAGLIALILVATTVAGGIGLVGYRLFGPGSDQNNGDGLQLFAAKPKDASTSSDSSNAAPKDGNSASLQYLSQANTTPKEAELKPTEAPKDETAASAAAAKDAAAAGGANGAINAAGSAGNGVNKGMLKTNAKFGALSNAMGGGGGGSVVSGGPGKTSGTGIGDSLANGKNGSLGAMKKGTSVAGGGSRAVASRKGVNSGMRQALGALADNRGATTSYGAGRTYDGSAAQNAGPTGPGGGEIGMGGPGTSAGAQPTSTPNTATDAKEFKAPPTPTSVDAAPWQNAINTVRGIIAAASILLMIAGLISKVKPWGPAVAKIIGFVVAGLGAMVVALGAQIAGGQYGQKLQGGVLAAAGLGLIVAGLAAGLSDTTNGKGKVVPDGDPNGAGISAFDASSDANPSFMSSVSPFILIGGGLTLVGLAGSMMAPIQKYPSSQFQDGNPPDLHFFGYVPPSESAVKTMIG